jgi:hypothetical protein
MMQLIARALRPGGALIDSIISGVAYVDDTSIHWLPCHGRAMSSCACKRFDKRFLYFVHQASSIDA